MDYNKINKQNIEKWENALEYITRKLKENNIPYYLSASGLHYIQGSKIYPYDIDVFTSKENVKKAYEILKGYKTSNLHYCEEEKGKLLEFQGIYNDIPFEVCEWEREPKEIKFVEFKNIIIDILK